MAVRKRAREEFFKRMVRASLTAHQTSILVERQAETDYRASFKSNEEVFLHVTSFHMGF